MPNLGLSEFGRFSQPALLILISLAGGPKHGSGMVADIEAMDGTHLGPATLYGAIARLEDYDLIEALPNEGRRRPYRITAAGERVLEVESDKLQRLVAISTERLVAPW